LEEEILDSRKAEEIWFRYHSNKLAILYCDNCEEIFIIPTKLAYSVRSYNRYANCCKKPRVSFFVGPCFPKRWKSPKNFLEQLKPLQRLLFELEICSTS